jgi:hypothetical protein
MDGKALPTESEELGGEGKQLAGPRHTKLRLPCAGVRRAMLGRSLNLESPIRRVLLCRESVDDGSGTPST